MKEKIYHYFGFMKYLYFWIGSARICAGILCIIFFPLVLQSDNSLLMKIILSIILGVCAFGCFVEGIPNIKDVIRQHSMNEFNRLHSYDQEEK